MSDKTETAAERVTVALARSCAAMAILTILLGTQALADNPACGGGAATSAQIGAYLDAKEHIWDIDRAPSEKALTTLTDLLLEVRGEGYAAFRANIETTLARSSDVHPSAALGMAQRALETLTDMGCDAFEALWAEAEDYRRIGAVRPAARIFDELAAARKAPDDRSVRKRFLMDAAEALWDAGDLERARSRYRTALDEATAADDIEDQAEIRQLLFSLELAQSQLRASANARRTVNYNAAAEIEDAAICPTKNILATLGKGRQAAPEFTLAGTGVESDTTVVQLWDMETKAALWNHPSPGKHLVFSADCTLLAEAGIDRVSMIDSASGRVMQEFPAGGPVDISPDNRFLWINNAVLDLHSGAVEWVMPAPADPRSQPRILALDYAQDVYLVAQPSVKAVEIRHRSGIQPTRTLPIPDNSAPTAATISRDGSTAIVGTAKGSFLVVDLHAGTEWHLDVSKSAISSVGISKHGATLMIRDGSGKVSLIDIRKISASRTAQSGMAAVSTDEDGIGLWQRREFGAPLEIIDFPNERTKELAGPGGEINAITFAPNSRELIFSERGAIYSLDFRRGRIRPMPVPKTPNIQVDPLRLLRTSSDGQTVFAPLAEENALLVLDRVTAQSSVQTTPHREGIHTLQLIAGHADAREDRILSAGPEGPAYLWNPFTGVVEHKYGADNGAVKDLAISADGSRVLSSGEDGAVRLFDVRRGTSTIQMRYAGKALQIALSSDGALAAACAAGDNIERVDLWNLPALGQPRQWPVSCSNGMAFLGDQTLVVFGSSRIVALNTSSGQQFQIAEGDLDGRALGVAEAAGRVMYRQKGGVVLADVRQIWSSPAAPLPVARVTAIQRWPRTMSISSDGRIILSTDDDDSVHVYNAASDSEGCHFVNKNVDITKAAVSASGERFFAPLENGYVALWTTATCKPYQVIKHPERVDVLRLSKDGARLATASDAGSIVIFNAVDGTQVARAPGHDGEVVRALMSPQGRYVATMGHRGDLRVWNARTEAEVRRLKIHVSDEEVVDPEFVFLSETRIAVHETGTPDVAIFIFEKPKVNFPSHIGIWDIDTGKEVGAIPSRTFPVYLFKDQAEAETVLSLDRTGPFLTAWNYHRRTPDFQVDVGAATAPALSADGKLVAFRLADGRLEVWDHDKRRELFSVVLADSGQWTIFTPDGRFETQSFDQSTLISWVLPTLPFRALPMEFLTREYFEGGLVPKVMSGGLTAMPTPALKSLERPEVVITAVESDKAGQVTVSVKLTRGPPGTGEEAADGATWPPVEVRLFRDGELMAVSDETSPGRVPLAPGTDTLIRFPNVLIPYSAGRASVRFTAYAFNPEGVRSEISQPYNFTPAAPTSQAARRAYVVSVGVNASTNPYWDLHFAANDAREIIAQLRARASTAVEVVPVSLTSEADLGAPMLATRAHLEAVLGCLATGACDSPLVQQIPSGAELRQARPEDFVILFVASHGYQAADGLFYLFPADVNQDSAAAPTSSVLETAISADLLRRWVLPLNSQHIAIVLDTCYSQYAVDTKNFKPAPLPNRNFGQLAFDKGMKVLAAAKAVESDDPALQHGWLTYRLLVEGLRNGKADFDPRDGAVSLTEWLRYGESVPAQRPASSSRAPSPEAFLFDFGEWRDDLMMTPGPLRKP